METTTFQEYHEKFRLFNARRGVDTSTLDYYHNYMDRFFRYTGAKIDDFCDRKKLLNQYEKLYKIESIKNETRKKHLKVLRMFLDFLEENEIITENIARKIKPPRVPRALPRPLEDHEINKIFDIINTRYTGFLRDRNEMIIKTFLNSGLRLMELLNLQKNDIVGNRLFVRAGKGDKDRLIYLTEEFAKEIEKYKNTYPSSNIFTNIRGGDLGESGLKRLFENIKKYTKNPTITAHRLRHTYATKLMENGVDAGVIKEQMGHADISTTNRYIGVRDAHRQKVMEVLRMEF